MTSINLAVLISDILDIGLLSGMTLDVTRLRIRHCSLT